MTASIATARVGRLRTAAALAFVLLAGAAPAPARADRRASDPATSPVLLVGPPEARLLVQIRRELAASGFPVIERALAPDALAPTARAAVVVDGDDRVRVWMADVGDAPARLRADLVVDGTDPHARRRACLAVVEYLRFGALGDPAPPTPLEPAPIDLRLPAAALADADDPAPPRRPWALSAATTVNFDAGMGEPTSHAQLTAQLALGGRWALTVTGLWPVLGAQFQTPEQLVRMWTAGAAAGLRWALPRPLPRLQPFLGAALGARFVLSDSESIETRQSRVVFTPSATLGGSAGLLVEVGPLVHLLLEGNVAWMGMIPLRPRTPWETAAARGRATHAALGVLFEY